MLVSNRGHSTIGLAAESAPISAIDTILREEKFANHATLASNQTTIKPAVTLVVRVGTVPTVVNAFLARLGHSHVMTLVAATAVQV